MDLLSQRYASPNFMLEQMVSMNMLCKFVQELYNLDNDKKLWEIYLHKVYGKSFAEFKESLSVPTIQSKQELEATVLESFNLLQSFNPETEVEA